MPTRNLVIDRSEPGAAIVVLTGEHETFTAERLRRELTALIAERTPIVIDLSNTTFLDSAIVGVILHARGDALAGGVRFALVVDEHTGPAVQRLLELTGLDSVLPIADSRAAALAG